MLMAAAAAFAMPLAACQKPADPNLDQEEGNAIDNSVADIENVPEDGLSAPDSAINDMESQSGNAD